jgi:hypothetical protein
MQIDYGVTQILADYIIHWGNGWFPVHNSGREGPFILIQIPTLCGVGLERDLAFILSYVFSVPGI